MPSMRSHRIAAGGGAPRIPIPGNVSNGPAVGLTASLLVHSGLIVILVSWPASRTSLPAHIPISVVTIDAAARPRQPKPFRPQLGSEPGSARSKVTLSQANDAQTSAAEKLGQTPNRTDESTHPSDILADQDVRMNPDQSSWGARLNRSGEGPHKPLEDGRVRIGRWCGPSGADRHQAH